MEVITNHQEKDCSKHWRPKVVVVLGPNVGHAEGCKVSSTKMYRTIILTGLFEQQQQRALFNFVL